MLSSVKLWLSQNFEMKDLGEASDGSEDVHKQRKEGTRTLTARIHHQGLGSIPHG
jgi:hypothetical protein